MEQAAWDHPRSNTPPRALVTCPQPALGRVSDPTGRLPGISSHRRSGCGHLGERLRKPTTPLCLVDNRPRPAAAEPYVQPRSAWTFRERRSTMDRSDDRGEGVMSNAGATGDPVVRRHDTKVSELVSRTRADVTTEAAERRSFGLEFLRESRAPAPVEPRLVSSAHGEITQILLTIPAYAVSSAAGPPNPLSSTYRELLTKLPNRIRTVVVTHEAVAKEVESWLAEAGLLERAIVVPAPDHLNFSVWAEDGYVVVEDAQSARRFLVEPYEFPRFGDSLIADLVRNQSELLGNQAPPLLPRRERPGRRPLLPHRSRLPCQHLEALPQPCHRPSPRRNARRHRAPPVPRVPGHRPRTRLRREHHSCAIGTAAAVDDRR